MTKTHNHSLEMEKRADNKSLDLKINKALPKGGRVRSWRFYDIS